MSNYKSSEEVREEHLSKMGPELGAVFYELSNGVTGLHIKWKQYVELYGTKPERIELLNEAASLFFSVVQQVLWDDTLLHLTRLTDPPRSFGKPNLTLRLLPPLIDNDIVRSTVEALINDACKRTGFARDWRNRRIAHSDLQLALEEKARPLEHASRQQVREALAAVDAVLNSVSEHFFDFTTRFDLVSYSQGDAGSLLYVIRDGLKVEHQRLIWAEEGGLDPDDLLGGGEI